MLHAGFLIERYMQSSERSERNFFLIEKMRDEYHMMQIYA